MDPKKQYVVDAIVRCVAGTLEHDTYVSQLANDPAVEQFMTDVDTRTLMAYRSTGSEVVFMGPFYPFLISRSPFSPTACFWG